MSLILFGLFEMFDWNVCCEAHTEGMNGIVLIKSNTEWDESLTF